MANEIFLKNLSFLPLVLKERLLSLNEADKASVGVVQEYAKNEKIFYKNFIINNEAVFNYDEYEERIKEFKEKYPLYQVLYFYGLSNAFMIENLLQNSMHCHLVVYEKNLALLNAVLFHIDLSEALKEGRLLLFTQMSDMAYLSDTQPFLAYSRTYFLELMSGFYAKDEQEILKLNTFLMKNFKDSILNQGNDPNDSLQGIRQYVYNLTSMIENPSLRELKAKRKAKFKSCVIVSTGPSLSKQLPLLKEVQEKVIIFAADSAYPILMQNDIVPDYVCMVERTDFTAEFFKHDFGAKDDKTTFLLVSLVHPNAINYLEKRKKHYMLIPKYLDFARFINLKPFGLINSAVSVAHMSLVVAELLDFENIVFIGQDLAYAEDGSSHSKNYQHGESFESEAYGWIELLAYGGEGFVKSHFMWEIFKRVLEDLVRVSKAKVYNATQGGARIEGMIEKPFSECCKEFNEDKTKLTHLKPLSYDKQSEQMLKAYAKVNHVVRECKKIKDFLERSYKEIEPKFLKLNELELDEALLLEKELLQDVDRFREAIFEAIFEAIQPFFVQFNLNLNKILVLNPLSKEDFFNKNVLVVKEHLDFMQSIFGFTHAELKTLEFAITPLENALKDRKLNKYQERLKR